MGGVDVNTSHIWGDYGIHECSDYLKSRGVPCDSPVYAANHIRALLDRLFYSATLNHDLSFYSDISDSLDDYTLYFIQKIEDTKSLIPEPQRSIMLEWTKRFLQTYISNL
jgi:hypothetical protein